LPRIYNVAISNVQATLSFFQTWWSLHWFRQNWAYKITSCFLVSTVQCDFEVHYIQYNRAAVNVLKTT